MAQAGEVPVTGHLHPRAQPQNDQGPADPATPLHVTVTFRRTAAQEADFARLAAAQQEPSSPDYHRWLTRDAFADRFGLDDASLARVRNWLESKGLVIENQANGRNWIAFSAPLSDVELALHTSIRKYQIRGQTHYAPATEPRIPAELAPFIAGFRGLDDFSAQPISKAAPALAAGGGANVLSPDDLAVLYDIAPLYGAGIDGSGQTIAVVGTSSIDLDDIRAYRNMFHLPAMDPQIVLVPNQPAIGKTTAGQREASLDLEIAGAVARKAQLIYVYGLTVEDALRQAIDSVTAPVISSSYQICEPDVTGTMLMEFMSEAQNAAVKGITWVNASGDSGPAGCDEHSTPGVIASQGPAVNFFAAIPQVTAVGGTEFNEQSGVYWAGASSPTFESALMAIPEKAWNDSSPAIGLDASGGGPSQMFAKPLWQSKYGILGSWREVPDIALSASGRHDPYVFCNAGSCANGKFGADGGTSAAAPAFAGMVALLNQYLNGQAGNITPVGAGNINMYLYPASVSNVLRDVTMGDNLVPCVAGSPACSEGVFGYKAGSGYDLVTGLGSVDADSLVTAYASAVMTSLASSTVTLTSASTSASPPALVPGGSLLLTVNVQCQNTGASGTVSLTNGAATVAKVPLTNGGALATLLSTQLIAGPNQIVAHFGGNSSCLPKTSTPLTVMYSNPRQASSVQIFVTPGVIQEQSGPVWNYTVTLRETAGGSATITGFKEGATNLTNQIAATFQSTAIGPYAELIGQRATTGIAAVPSSLPIEIDGIDDATQARFSVIANPVFLGYAGQAALQLTSEPSAVQKNAGSSGCPWSEHLILRELGGTGVNLTSFVTGKVDQSPYILSFWKTSTVPALGQLESDFCWSNLPVPALLGYRIGGTDANGNPVSAAVLVPFLDASLAPNTLSVSLSSVAFDSAAPHPVLVNVTASGGGQIWTARARSGAAPGWLHLSQYSGIGSATLAVSATVGTLAAGTYSETLLFESLDAVPQSIAVPITFVVH